MLFTIAQLYIECTFTDHQPQQFEGPQTQHFLKMAFDKVQNICSIKGGKIYQTHLQRVNKRFPLWKKKSMIHQKPVFARFQERFNCEDKTYYLYPTAESKIPSSASSHLITTPNLRHPHNTHLRHGKPTATLPHNKDKLQCNPNR